MALRYARELCRERVFVATTGGAAAAAAAALLMVVLVGQHGGQHDDPSSGLSSERIQRLLNYCKPKLRKKCLLEEKQQSKEEEDGDDDGDNFQLEIDFLDKLAAKSYLQHSGASSVQQDGARPEAVPPTLRLLTVNVLPELISSARSSRLAHGECRLALHQTYPDAVVPPKVVPIEVRQQHQPQHRSRRGRSSSKTVEIQVEQKALVKQLWQCYHHGSTNNQRDTDSAGKLGIQIMEADMHRLNPRRLQHPLRQTLLRHYVTRTHGKQQQQQPHEKKKNKTTAPFREHIQWDDDEDEARTTLDDELEAPWHQHAWVSELQLRLQGRVPFGVALDPSEGRRRSSWFSWFRNSSDRNNPYSKFTYAATVPSQRQWRDYLSWWFQPLPGEAGQDGRDAQNFADAADNDALLAATCWAAQRPHAVIADGAAVQQVSPRALRLLQKTCHDNDIPLYVLRNENSEFPFTRRSLAWDSNDEINTTTTTTTRIPPSNLGAALRDLRRRLKRRIVHDQLHRAAGSAFARGRSLGQWETAVQWQAAEAAAAVRQAQQQRREHNWRHLSAPQLEEELRKRGVVTFVKTTNSSRTRHFSNALQALLEDYCQQQPKAAKPNDTAQKDDGDEHETTPATADDDDEI